MITGPCRRYLQPEWAMAAIVLLAAATAPAEAQRRNRNHWTTDADIGRGDGPVDDQALRNAPANPAEWLHFGGNYASWRHSPIERLTPGSVGDLKLAWMAQTGVPGQLETSPIVYDGILYLTSARNRLQALDAKTGTLHWRYDHPLPDDLRLCCGPANRGVAIAGDVVLMATLDAKLVALHRKTGEIAWETTIDDHTQGFSATSAPLVTGDVAVIGVGGGEYGVRGYFDAYDVTTGERRWRHYTVPAAGEPGVETWAAESYLTGGAATWSTGAYDPDTDTLFWTTGNPSPDWNGDDRRGDNLYSDSVLAVDPSTGARKWHFQFTPHDVWDYDGNSEIWLVDIEINGQQVPVLAQANRNGYLYLLDRRDGRFLRATQYADQVNWGTVGADGRPTVDPAMMPAENPEVRVCPGLAGGNNAAYAGAVNPDLGLAFVPVIESCAMFRKRPAVFRPGLPFFGGSPVNVDRNNGDAYGHLSAVDLTTGDVRWQYRDPYPMMAGVLSTAGGLVVTGNATGDILGFDARTGEEVWRVQTGSGIRSHPIAYELDGTVYLAGRLGRRRRGPAGQRQPALGAARERAARLRVGGDVRTPVIVFGLTLIVAAGALTQAGQPVENPFAGDAEAIEAGRGLLEAVCAGYCHATEEGETTDAPDLFDCEWWHGDTDGDLFTVVRDGVPNTRMQSFGGQFPVEDLWRIIAAIRADSRCRDGAR